MEERDRQDRGRGCQFTGPFPAEASGHIQLLDRLVSCNGIPLGGLTYPEATSIISRACQVKVDQASQRVYCAPVRLMVEQQLKMKIWFQCAVCLSNDNKAELDRSESKRGPMPLVCPVCTAILTIDIRPSDLV